MEQVPFKRPTFGLPKSMSVVAVGGRLRAIFKLGMRTAMEQSNVPLVFTRKIVGSPALATLFLGIYPPLAVISTICLSSMILTLFAGNCVSSF